MSNEPLSRHSPKNEPLSRQSPKTQKMNVHTWDFIQVSVHVIRLYKLKLESEEFTKLCDLIRANKLNAKSRILKKLKIKKVWLEIEEKKSTRTLFGFTSFFSAAWWTNFEKFLPPLNGPILKISFRRWIERGLNVMHPTLVFLQAYVYHPPWFPYYSAEKWEMIFKRKSYINLMSCLCLPSTLVSLLQCRKMRDDPYYNAEKWEMIF
jgi:hypothetical protein